jgi:dihydropteroate synthase
MKARTDLARDQMTGRDLVTIDGGASATRPTAANRIGRGEEEMNPYRLISEDATHVTYEYRSAYTWTLYTALLALFIGMTLPNDAVSIAAGIAVAAYFIAKLALGSEATRRIKKAMQSNSVQISGNKASFSNPLRIRVPK